MLVALAVGVAFALIAWSLAGVIEARRDVQRAAAIRAAMGSPADAAAYAPGKVATLEGRISTESPGITSFHPRGTSFLEEPNVYATTHHADERLLVLDLGEGKSVVIDGDVQIMTGRLESEHGASLDRAAMFDAAPLRERTDLRTRTGQFRRVAPGDVVRVRGVVEPAPDDAALYRASSNVVCVRPAPSDAPSVPCAVTIASTIAPVRVRTRPFVGRWAATGAALLLGGATGAYVFANATATIKPGTPASAAQPACRDAVLELLAKNRADAATKSLETCSDPYAHAMVDYANGAFEAASDAFAKALQEDPSLRPSLSETEAHLFAHQDARAAGAAHRMVSHFYPGPSTAEKRHLECVAGLLERLAAGEARDPKQKALHQASCSKSALLKLAHEVDAEHHLDEFHEFPASYEAVGNPFTAVVGTRARLAARPVGVERDILDRFVLAPGPTRPIPPDSMGQGTDYGLMGYGRIGYFAWGDGPDIYSRLTAFAAELVLFYAYAGEPERAAPYWPVLDRVAATREAKPQQSFHQSTGPGWADVDRKEIEGENQLIEHVMSIAAGAALLAGDEARVQRYASHGEPHSASVLLQVNRMLRGAPWETPKEEDHWADRRELFSAAGTDDGARIANVLARQHATGRDTLPRLVPRLRSNRSALDTWFDEQFPAPCLTCGASTYFGHVSDRRSVAKLLGKSAEEARLAPVVTRFVDAQTDPRIAWELAELETFFAGPR